MNFFKKIGFLAATLQLILGVSAQKIDRNLVVVEVGTGTWCTYCPGAALGVDDLVHNGHKVAVIEYHNGDEYANGYSNARNSYYQVSGYPTTNFDGGNAYSGGHPSQSLYGTFLVKYQDAIAKQTAIAMEMNYSLNNDSCFARFIVKKVDEISGSLTLHLAVTESHIQKNWQGLTELNFVERTMIPNSDGTVLNFTEYDADTVDLAFKISPDWKLANCEIVAFVQDKSTREIHNGLKDYLEILEHDIDVKLQDIAVETGNGYCKEQIPITAKVVNRGNDLVETIRFAYSINNEEASYFTWKGELESRADIEIELPALPFTLAETNDVQVSVELVNSENDGDNSNNLQQLSFNKAPVVESITVKLELKTDSFGGETSWQITNVDNEVVYSGGPYADNMVELHEYDFVFENNGCYKFDIFDSAGDGLDGTYDMAYVKFIEGNGAVLIDTSNFGAGLGYSFIMQASENQSDFISFKVGETQGVLNNTDHEISIDLNLGDEIYTPEFVLSTGAVAYINDVEQISGESTISLTNSETISYKVVSGDGTSTTEWQVNFNLVSVNQLIGKPEINLYPNPFSQKISIDETQNISQIKIVNSLGKEVYNTHIISIPVHTIDLSNQKAGIYFISIVDHMQSVSTQKIVKQN